MRYIFAIMFCIMRSFGDNRTNFGLTKANPGGAKNFRTPPDCTGAHSAPHTVGKAAET
jgi:hypothetical protein